MLESVVPQLQHIRSVFARSRAEQAAWFEGTVVTAAVVTEAALQCAVRVTDAWSGFAVAAVRPWASTETGVGGTVS